MKTPVSAIAFRVGSNIAARAAYQTLRFMRHATPSTRPRSSRSHRKRLVPVVDLNDGRRQNRGEESRQKEENHRHRQNRRQRRGFFLSHGHS
jgi:hypothetical protein